MYRKHKALVVSDALCGILFLVSLLAFLLIGIFKGVWHPTWVLIPSVCLVDGILTIVVSTCVKLFQKNETKTISKEEKEDK